MKYLDFFAHIATIEEKLGYSFADKSLLAQAFTRTSFCNENNATAKNGYQSNEVLEFLGDSVLSIAVATMLTEENSKRYEYGIKTEFAEGDFSNIKSRLSDKTNLSESIKKLGIQKFLLMGDGDIKLDIQNEPSVMEDLFESIIGAVYIDSGKNLPVIMRVIGKMLDVSLYLENAKTVAKGASKNLLQEWCAEKSRRLPVPTYTLYREGPDHAPLYVAECKIGEKLYGRGVGKNRKAAEAEAAHSALQALLNEDCSLRREEESYAELVERARRHPKLLGNAPVFRDLGETEASTKTRPEFAVECQIKSFTARGVGASKKEAKTVALKSLLSQI